MTSSPRLKPGFYGAIRIKIKLSIYEFDLLRTNAVRLTYDRNHEQSQPFRDAAHAVTKERLDQAAEIKGLSTSQWALSNLLVAADRDIQESHVLYLDDEQWNSFIKSLDEPMPTKMVELLESEPIWK